jgi:hypothetical protein
MKEIVVRHHHACFLAVVLGPAALAQSTPPPSTPLLPTIYLWTSPTDTDPNWQADAHFVPMVRVFVDESATSTANAVVSRAAQLDALIPPDTMCVLLQNFGSSKWSPATSFIRGADGVDVETDASHPGDDWPDGTTADQRAEVQPWLTAGRANARAWMDSFVAQYHVRQNADRTGTVDENDLTLFVSAWLQSAPLADPSGDGVVEEDDLQEFLVEYGENQRYTFAAFSRSARLRLSSASMKSSMSPRRTAS